LTTIDLEEEQMNRVQLALNVTDVDAAVDFYTKLFRTEPAKRRPGYANFAIDEPALKLVLIESNAGGTLNHLGVEVGSTDEVTAASSRLVEQGLQTSVEDNVACCYALQDKVWVSDPDGAPWEVYTVLADADQMACDGTSKCCEVTVAGASGAASCC
jgi:catechol 2,3-dioxygenase-like lactoylglutathione lyase family enzyme